MLLPEYKYFIGLGSNIGDRQKHIIRAIEKINTIGFVEKQSRLYKTEPWGKKDQDYFLNAVILVRTDLNPWDLLKKLIAVERERGKQKTEHWGPRSIDLDILYADQKVIYEKDLVIPHPFLHLRNFVLVPLAGIAGQFLHPLLRKTTLELIKECPDQSQVVVCSERS